MPRHADTIITAALLSGVLSVAGVPLQHGNLGTGRVSTASTTSTAAACLRIPDPFTTNISFTIASSAVDALEQAWQCPSREALLRALVPFAEVRLLRPCSVCACPL